MACDAEYTLIKSDTGRRRCLLIPIHRTVRMIYFWPRCKIQVAVLYMKTFIAGEFISQRLGGIITILYHEAYMIILKEHLHFIRLIIFFLNVHLFRYAKLTIANLK